MGGELVDVLWARRLHLRSYAMAVGFGSVVVAERNSRLVRLDAVSGEPYWDRRVEDCWGTPVIAGGRCLYLSQAGVLHCFDLATGQPLWSRPGLNLRGHLTVSGSAVFVGGWRGYHPLTRVALADGSRLPIEEAATAEAGPLARPLPLWVEPERDAGGPAVLVAGAARPALLVMAASGIVLSEWALPQPVFFPDAGEGYRVSADGRVVFLSGPRTVMTFHPARGVQVLWRHVRDIHPLPPILDEQTLWLLDDTGITVVDVDRGVVVDEQRLPHRAVHTATLTANRAVFALADGSIIAVDRTGSRSAPIRVPRRVDRLVAGEGDLVHAIGKGHLVTFRGFGREEADDHHQ
ncbi:PQQ-binding-like beta-propeller repeat protein [Actinoplanes regularis]|uniref:outer membrane protein assembly factor BamB family protein n=1 Tax=Actinoplanes regularis TaxID=52697 RepID=UPI00255286C8|nr:PQQ-binding-like beta-propeller repeat protein [Actinoplanes regularis]